MVLTAILLSTVPAISAGLQGQTIRYGPQDQYSGYLSLPAGTGAKPGMVMIHEWWGLNDYIRLEADKLAGEGYAVLAVDLFGKSTTDMNEAMQMVRSLNQQAATAELLTAADYVRSIPGVPDSKVGVIGWCFGGGQALTLALNDPWLAATVIYYGTPVTDLDRLRQIRSPILGFFGKEDQSIPVDKVKAFRRALSKAGVSNQIYIYPGAGHAFANPSGGERYRPEAAADAWKKTLAFLNENLKQPMGMQ